MLVDGACGTGSSVGNAGPPLVWEKPFGNCIASPYWYAHLLSDEVVAQVGALDHDSQLMGSEQLQETV